MPLITDVSPVSGTKYKIKVKPDGTAAADGRIYAGDFAGSTLTTVGTWRSKANADGEGEADTAPGVFLRAEQNNVLSDPAMVPQLVPVQPQVPPKP